MVKHTQTIRRQFAKELHHRVSTGLKIGFLLMVWNIELTNLSRENTQPENMCDIAFEKVQGRAEKVNRTSVYAEAAVRRVL